MGSHGSISTELKLRTNDLKHFIHPRYVKGMTRSDIPYGRRQFQMEPLHGQEVLVIVGRFRHRIDGSGTLLSDSWQGLTYDMAAVYGNLEPNRLSFETLVGHHFDRWMNHRCYGNDDAHQLFILGPGEFVRGLDISWKVEAFVGIRVQTNQRQSQWFGNRNGIVKTVTAPQGYFINYICNLKTKTRKWEVGLRLCPILDHCGQTLQLGCLVTRKSERVGEPSEADGIQTEFIEMQDEIRAIVVQCGKSNTIESINVLSPEQYNRHLAKREDPLWNGQNLIYFRQSERLVRVDVVATDKVHALRFHSNLCVSPWYGDQGKSPKIHTFSAQDEGLDICGFYGTFGYQFVNCIGVYYYTPMRENAKDADVYVPSTASQSLA